MYVYGVKIYFTTAICKTLKKKKKLRLLYKKRLLLCIGIACQLPIYFFPRPNDKEGKGQLHQIPSKAGKRVLLPSDS